MSDRPASRDRLSSRTPTRRELFAVAGSAAGVAALGAIDRTAPAASAAEAKRDPFRYALNTGTIRGQKLPIDKQIDVAIEAGYDGIEPWVRDIAKHAEAGGSLDDLRKKCADHNLAVCSGIGFANWIVDDDTRRAKGYEDAKRDMDLLRKIGGTHLAAPPAGANKGPKVDLWAAAERYRKLCEIGHDLGVIPQVEVWGFSANLSKLSESTFVAIEAGHPDATILPDSYHLYKGGNDPASLKILGKAAVYCFHVNDYPDIPRDKINDADRVYPGDGVAPLDFTYQTLHANGVACFLSLELFNRDYWKQPAIDVAKTGLAKSKAAVAKALKL